MEPPGSSDLPNIFEYLDFRRFLEDWFQAKKALNPKFSYRMFARLAGQKSPSLLHHVVRGERNLTPATTRAFSQAMKLTAPEAGFFEVLVRLGQASADPERKEAWEQIAATKRFREARTLEGAGFEYVSRWYYPAIRELALRPDFKDDPAWIAETLRPRISRREATRALQTLFTLGLLARDDDGRVAHAEATVVTPHEFRSLAAYSYHHGMLERAREAIEEVAAEERQFGGLTVAIGAHLVPRLKDEITRFYERILNLCDEDPGPADRVYQVNLQLFPLSEPREPS